MTAPKTSCKISSVEHSVNNDTAQRLLAMCVYEPSPARLNELCARYDTALGWVLYGLCRGDALAGVVGVRAPTTEIAVIQHLAVLPMARRQGVGRQLILHLIDGLQFHDLEAETDGDPVEFYRRCGFAIQSLGEIYPGVERFRCTLR